MVASHLGYNITEFFFLVVLPHNFGDMEGKSYAAIEPVASAQTPGVECFDGEARRAPWVAFVGGRERGAVMFATCLALVALALMAKGPVSPFTTRLVAHNTSAGDVSFSSWNTSEEVTASDLNCSDYDDDTVYTNDSCVVYDQMSCDMYCISGSWCDHFCGDECARGGGAICALTVLSNLTKSCEKNGLCSAPGEDTSVESDDLAPTPKPTASRASANGCDHHAICSYCLPNENCRELVEDDVIQAANMAMLLLSEFEQTCSKYGCSDWGAAESGAGDAR